MSEMLRLEAVTAGYGRKEIVRNIHLVIGEGELCALLGLNGSGKTTLIKAICGLIPMESGRCLVKGQDCTRVHERKRARFISYIPQRHSKMQGVTVLDAVQMGYNPHLALLESPTALQRRQAGELLERLGLDALAGQDFAHLSEGQKQMVILARTLAQDAPVMLMDEPDSALDFLNRNQILGRIRELIHRENKAGLITLHDPNLALGYCDRLILLKGGTIAGQLEPARATKEEIRRCLSKIYGDIAVLEHRGEYIMLME